MLLMLLGLFHCLPQTNSLTILNFLLTSLGRYLSGSFLQNRHPHWNFYGFAFCFYGIMLNKPSHKKNLKSFAVNFGVVYHGGILFVFVFNVCLALLDISISLLP